MSRVPEAQVSIFAVLENARVWEKLESGIDSRKRCGAANRWHTVAMGIVMFSAGRAPGNASYDTSMATFAFPFETGTLQKERGGVEATAA